MSKSRRHVLAGSGDRVDVTGCTASPAGGGVGGIGKEGKGDAVGARVEASRTLETIRSPRREKNGTYASSPASLLSPPIRIHGLLGDQTKT